MRFPLLARSPNSAGFLLIAAISGRALAAAARRAGYRPLVADFFCDTDTVAMAERAMRLPGDLQQRHRRQAPGRHASAAGRKRRPGRRRSGVGLRAQDRSSSTRSPANFRWPAIARPRSAGSRTRNRLPPIAPTLGIPHPAFQSEPPPDPENWVVKTAGGAGGSHIRRANGEAPASDRYFQRFVSRPQHLGAVHRRRPRGAHRRLQPAMDVAGTGRALPLWRRGAAAALRPAGCGGDRRLAFRACAPRRAGRALQRRPHPRRRTATSSSRSIRGRAPRSIFSTAPKRR